MLVLAVIVGVVLLVVGNYGGNFGGFLASLTGNGAKLLTTFGGKGTGAGFWNDAKHLAVDGKGYVYVDDQKTGRIQRFDANGKYVSYWDVPLQSGTGPDCLTADRAGNVYVCEGGQLFKYDGSTGKSLATYASPTETFGIDGLRMAAATLDGGVVADDVNSTDGDRLLIFDASGNTTASYPKLLSAQANNLYGDTLAVDGLGNLFFLDWVNEVVLLYGADGKYINRFGSHGRGADQFNYPLSIAVDGQSRIYVGDRQSIKVFDSTGRYLTTYTIPGGTIYTTYSLAFGDGGTLYALCMDNADNEQAQVFKLQLPNQNSGK
jgi:tripartite motif-containing protein 2/3